MLQKVRWVFIAAALAVLCTVPALTQSLGDFDRAPNVRDEVTRNDIFGGDDDDDDDRESSARGSYDWIVDESVFGIEVGNTIIVDAHRDADGILGGRLYYRQEFLDQDLSFLIKLTCFEIYDGNRAKVGGFVEWTNDPTVEGLFGWFQALDNGDLIPTESTLVGFGDETANEDFCNSPATPNFGPFEVNGRLHVDPGDDDEDDDDDD